MHVLRKILFPFSFIYDAITSIRNYLFDINVLKSKHFSLPIIAVGNLCVGGTGKSPMIEYLIRLLNDKLSVATLSRGYRRKSKGFVLSNLNSTSDDIGDEPLQFKNKFPNVSVAVDADRQNGISSLINLENPDVILLDDAFQHRKVTAGFYILLTKYDKLFVNDLLLPAGDLRESKRGASRADVIIITKCPNNLSLEQQNTVAKKLKNYSNKNIFFTTIAYDSYLRNYNNSILLSSLKNKAFTLVTGIANPKPLVDYLNELNLNFNHLSFKDHHNFSEKEINMLSDKDLIITTEKDYMRLKNSLTNVYYLPIVTEFLNDKELFDSTILSYAKPN